MSSPQPAPRSPARSAARSPAGSPTRSPAAQPAPRSPARPSTRSAARSPARSGLDLDYVEAVLSLVERVPAGRVTTYGLLAEAVGAGGPRQVGRVLSAYGGPVPWWRVVRADGSPPRGHEAAARDHYVTEGTPLRPSGRIDLTRAVWWP